MKKIYLLRLIIASSILILAVCAMYGFYPLHFLNLQITPLIQRNIVNYSLFALILISSIFLLTLLFGRFYCSMLCPFGILQEIVNLIYDKLRKKLPNSEYIKKTPYKYYVCALSFGLLLSGSALIIKYIDPYTIFGSYISLCKYGLIFTLIILVLVFFKNRLFCTSICPVGAILGILSKFAPFKMYINNNCVKCKMCTRYCPSKCIDIENKNVNNENCVKCLKCTSKCPKGAIRYGLKLNKPKFNIKKRSALISLSAGALFIGAYFAGIKFSKEIYSKIKNIMLPPGAKDSKSMANSCLNCNLCVKNCPQGILVKADKEHPFVHVDFSQGEHFCKYDCKKCSEVCPSGAIKKITLKEKQNTRIAMASINDNCISCKACISKCPKGAISIINNFAHVDGSKCIGCGACVSVCPMSAIEISDIKKQMEI